MESRIDGTMREVVHVWFRFGASLSLSLTLTRNEKVEYYIRIKTHQLIVLRF